MDNDIKPILHGTISSTGLIQFHDRTERQDAFELAKQKNFALDIPQADQEPQTNFRITKKAFAIVCQTTMSKEMIRKHLKQVFYKRVQYICISSPRDPSPNPSVVYIQIILHQKINAKTYFMRRVAGMRCNYRVTCDDLAWNKFLKKVGPCLEVGDFQSVRLRAGPRLRGAARQGQREKKKKLKSSTRSAAMDIVEPMANETVTNLTSVVTPFFERAIDLAFERIAAECAYQREVLKRRFETYYATL